MYNTPADRKIDASGIGRRAGRNSNTVFISRVADKALDALKFRDDHTTAINSTRTSNIKQQRPQMITGHDSPVTDTLNR